MNNNKQLKSISSLGGDTVVSTKDKNTSFNLSGKNLSSRSEIVHKPSSSTCLSKESIGGYSPPGSNESDSNRKLSLPIVYNVYEKAVKSLHKNENGVSYPHNQPPLHLNMNNGTKLNNSAITTGMY